MSQAKWQPATMLIEETYTQIPQEKYEEKMRRLALLILRSRYSPKISLQCARKRKARVCESPKNRTT